MLDSLEALVLRPLEQLPQDEDSVLQRLRVPLEQTNAIQQHGCRDIHSPALAFRGELAVHLCLQPMRPPQLLDDQICLLDQGHDRHQLLLESLHRQLMLPVTFFFSRSLFRLLLQLLNLVLSSFLCLLLTLFKLLLQACQLLSMYSRLLSCLGLLAGFCGLALVHLLLPLLLFGLHLGTKLSFPLFHQSIRFSLSLLLGLFCLPSFPLQLLRQLTRSLEFLFCGASHLTLLQLLPSSGVAHLPGVDELGHLALARLHKHEDALSEGHAVTVRQANCHIRLQCCAIDESGSSCLRVRGFQCYSTASVLHDGMLLVDPWNLKSHIRRVCLAFLRAASANSRASFLERKLELGGEKQILIEVGYVRELGVCRLLFLGSCLLRFRKPLSEALLHLHQSLLKCGNLGLLVQHVLSLAFFRRPSTNHVAQVLILLAKLPDELVLRILVDAGCVFDALGTIGIPQGGQSLFVIRRGW
mmetsp:Transcript_8252/g.19371  ORF Transcript_8252/g.19371 Transcript_8252/m.19371 type:complete len:470 (-) Transcript_8252:1130-2539(-)